MNKQLKITLIIFFILLVGIAILAVFKKNNKPKETFKTEKLSKANIINKVVATGKIIPDDEVEIKPQISGIIEKIYVNEGDAIKNGDLIATIKVVPNEQSLNSAKGRIDNAKIVLDNAKTEYNRNKILFEKGVISTQSFDTFTLNYNQAKQNLANAISDYSIIKRGSAGGSSTANTNVKATVSGTILEIPVKEGDQVIESNNFNAGTTISTIADLGKMIFEGKVDEAEVGKLKIGMPLNIKLGAIQDKEFDAKLRFIAPKGTEDQGAVQFKIEGDVNVESTNSYIRAGYSANADIVLEKKDSILVIKEALLQYDKDTKKPYVEVMLDEANYERRDIETGISDGINMEIISGLKEDDKIKVWNKLAKKDDKENEDN